MRIAIISTYTHPTRLIKRERSTMQSTVAELIAALCPEHAEIEVYNEKETEVPLDRHWDLVFFTYLHAFYEHTKVLSVMFRKRGMVTVAGGRHASFFPEDCTKYFDTVVVGEPEGNIPALVADFEKNQLQPVYRNPPVDAADIPPARYDVVDFSTNPHRLPGIEASRGCPFRCSFCVLTGHEVYRHRPVKNVIDEIKLKMRWNDNFMGSLRDVFLFQDNNLGGSPRYLRELCEALLPLKKHWGCAVTFNILRDDDLIKLMGRAGCRFIYTGLESLNPATLKTMNKHHQQIQELNQVIERVHSAGIMLTFGLIVGADGDTSEYLMRVPHYLSELKCFSIIFVGLMCPYPETPVYASLAQQGRILPGTSIRDYDGYTLCHRPDQLSESEVIEHYKYLCKSLGTLTNVAKNWWTKLFMSSAPGYKQTIMFSSPELWSIRKPVSNSARTYIAGRDPVEDWDREKMDELGIPLQMLS